MMVLRTHIRRIIYFIAILSLIAKTNSFPQGLQQTVKILAKINSSNNRNEPEIFFKNVSVIDENGIGRYYYGHCYLPNLAYKLKTIIHSINFEFISFDKIKIKLVYQNILPKEFGNSIYGKSELWKLNFYDNYDYNSFYPLLSFFISENPSREMSELEIYSSLSNISLFDAAKNKINFKKDINKIIYLPDSQFKLFEFPIHVDGKPYKFFAGHDVLLNVPLNDKIHTLEFTIDKYNNFKYKDGKIVFNFAFVISSAKVEIKACKIISKFNYEYDTCIYKAAKTAAPLGWADSTNYMSNVPILQDPNSHKGLCIWPTLQGLRMQGSETYELKKSNTDINLYEYSFRLILKEGLNVGIKESNSPFPLSIYDLLKNNSKILIPPVLEYFIINESNQNRSVTITSEILGLSYPEIKQKIITAKGIIKHKFIPTFISEKLHNIMRATDFEVYSKVIDNETKKIILESTNKVKILPYDTMVFRLIDESAGYTQLYHKYLTNWIRRINSSKLDSLLLSTAKLTYSKDFSGYNNSWFNDAKRKNIFKTEAEFTRNIVNAIYTGLNKLKPIYSNETLDFGRTNYQIGQRIKYPKETLEQGRGNCIDSSILFASILEMIGLNPVIVIVPGHAFIGWETWKNSNNYEYLETTMVGYRNFQDAYQAGMNEFSNASEKIIVNIKQCREEGLYGVTN